MAILGGSLPGLWRAPLAALEGARGRLFPFAAVFLGIGIGAWFALPFEPGRGFYLGAGLGFAALAAGGFLLPGGWRPLAVALACALAGALAGGARVAMVEAPTLGFRYYGPVEGRVVAIDRSQSDALRLTLDRVVLAEVAPARTPARVRISLHGPPAGEDPQPGQVVMLTAHLAAPEGAVEPGGFDFRRMAWFDRLGAVGYTRTPVLLLEPAEPGAQRVARLRLWLAAAVRARIPGDPGAFAAGVMTGDRSGLSPAATEALRDSSLAHLLAISGMNMVFLTGFVFALIRRGTALVPALALRIHAKKLAAVAALAVALFYLMLSGANVATERAFVMVAVMLGAVLLDRRALSLRSVAIAALVLLALAPESLLEPGFQMSFAATVALIAGFRAVEGGVWRGRVPRWLLPVFTLVLSSVIAGLATAPYAAAHFNRVTGYGLLANLLTVPVMGAVVMPAGAVAALLGPLGLAGPALKVMEWGSAWILAVAEWIAGLQGAVTAVPAPGAAVLPLVTLGALWWMLWPGRARLAGAAALVLALALWPFGGRPGLVIASDGGLVGLMGQGGRALSAARGGGFAAGSWLENDGDLATQDEAAARPGFSGPRGVRRFAFAGLEGAALAGKAGLAALEESCATADLVVVKAAPAESPSGGCVLIDQRLLRLTGALALRNEAGGIALRAARAGGRRWSGPPLDPAIPLALAAELRRRAVPPGHARRSPAAEVAALDRRAE